MVITTAATMAVMTTISFGAYHWAMQSGLVHVLLLFLGFTKLLLYILTTLKFTQLITNNHKLPPQLLLNILSNTANP